MTLSSFTVIAIDNNGQEHQLEQPGHHRRDAVHKLLSSERGKGLVEVLNGDKRKDFRKSIWLRPGCESCSPDPLPTEATSLGLAFTEAVSSQARDAARLILKDFENRGLVLGLFDEEGDQPTIVYPRGLTDEDKATIEENSDSLIAALRLKSTNGTTEKGSKRKTQRDIVRGILADPDLKTAFQRYDVELLLRRSGEHTLADDESKLDALLAWATQAGLITRTTRGNYRKIDVAPVAPPAAPLNEPTRQSVAAPAPAAVPAALAPAITEHAIIEPPPPPQRPEPIAMVASKVTPAPASSLQVESIRESFKQPSVMSEMIIALMAEVATGPVADSAIEDVANAVETFEREQLQSVDRLSSAIKALLAQIRTTSRVRKQLHSLMVSQSTD